MTITPLECGSSLWQKLVAHYEPQLTKLRARVENPAMPEADRIALCWQIKFIKEFLALEDSGEKK